MYIGFIVTSYLVGFLLSIAIEIPFLSMEEYFYDADDDTKRQYRLPSAVVQNVPNPVNENDGQEPGPSHRE